MKKILGVITAAAMALTMVACSSTTKAEAGYTIHIQGEDYGAGVDKIVVTLENSIDSVDVKDVKVEETKQNTDWSDETYPVVEQTTERTITKAYLVDKDGKETSSASNYVAIEMNIDPNEGSPFLYTVSTGYNSWSDPYKLSITIGDQKVEGNPTSKTTSADAWKTGSSKVEDYTYNYAEYVPDGAKTLFVWLHGAGEGGADPLGDLTDPYVTILANKVVALSESDFQDTMGGIAVVAPQCPTMWMDDGKGNQSEGARESIYLESLVSFIDQYVKDGGYKQVFIGGCSNGGYMTMNIAMDCGTKYDGYVPICEAMLDSNISDDDIDILKDCPLYFVYSEDDTTVDPTTHEIPTIERLEKAGAKNLHVSTTKHVYDLSDAYKSLKGEGDEHYTYSGHWSWIYFDNDETADADGVSAFDWLATLLK